MDKLAPERLPDVTTQKEGILIAHVVGKEHAGARCEWEVVDP